MAGGWIDYLSRSAFLLQQGRPVSDIAYFYGEEAPITGLYGDAAPGDIPAGHAYDFVDTGVLARLSVAADGALTTPEGMRYALLQLGGSSRHMTLATLRRVGALAAAGATIVGARPIGSPSLSDDDRAVREASDALWPREGESRAFADVPSALAHLGIARDWDFASDAGAADLALIHRRSADGEIYFVSNRRDQPARGRLTLRVAGRVPELWHADDGRIAPVSWRTTGATTTIALTLAPDEAVFILFRRPATADSAQVAAPVETQLASLADDGWQLRFAPDRGAPAAAMPAKLGSWTDSPLAGVRYFSGVGTYRRTLDMPRAWLKADARRYLDLGTVHEVAAVRINGRPVGTAWKAPYRVDVTDALHVGGNSVEIDVANLWVIA